MTPTGKPTDSRDEPPHGRPSLGARVREIGRERYTLLRRTIDEFMQDDATTLAAALAFYSALSMAPLLVLLIWAAGFMGEQMQAGLIHELVKLIGEEGGQAIGVIVDNAQQHPDLRSVAGLISIGVLVFSATSVFGQLQHSLNVIWDTQIKPGRGFRQWVRKRLLSLGLVATVGFLLLISLALSAGLSFTIAFINDLLPDSFQGRAYLWQVLNIFASLIIFTLLFAVIFKFLPDVYIAWKHVWGGALFTSLLFGLGKMLIAIYLGRSTIASAYGAAGSLVVLLVWVYYSSAILFFGAELTQVYAQMSGAEIIPEAHAERAHRKRRAWKAYEPKRP